MIADLQRVIETIENNWNDCRILVIGDAMLDRSVIGAVERLSPEAPVPVVRTVEVSDNPGGAANVAMNVLGLGGRVKLLGFCGDDSDGLSLKRCLAGAGVESELVVVSNHRTTMKTRVVAGKQQLLRVDSESVSNYPADDYKELIQRIEREIELADAVILSDYAKGALGVDVCRCAIENARRRGIPVMVDPKQRNFERYRGATTVCPNINELAVTTGIPGKNLEALMLAGQGLVRELGLEYLTFTLSEKGIAVLRPDSREMFPAVARQVFDVCGAGDTVVAALALSLATALNVSTAMQLANIAASIVIAKSGTVPVSKNELLTSLMPDIELQPAEKVLTLERLRKRIAVWRSSGDSIVFTNGCFDLLHIGHITLLEEARRQGQRLVVAINSDESVRRLKGSSRPVVGEKERAQVLAALAAVDAVIVFDDQTPLRLVLELRPDVLVKGGDYNLQNTVGAQEVESWGGRVKHVPIVEGFSTTRLIAKAAT